MARILIIDDYQEIRHLYTGLLENQGHQVEAVEGADKAVAKILKGGWDLILLDLLMPGKDGLWVLEQIRGKTPKKANGKILVMGFENHSPDTQKLVKKALQKGADAFVDKRIKSEKEVVNKIEKFL